MGGDYSRFPFDPMKGFTGILEQQGRVSLDSDRNEFEEILDRLRRSETYDVLGPAVSQERVVVPMTTPDGFEISVTAGGRVRIGPGRAYVHGIQLECFGDVSTPPLALDTALGGVQGTGPRDFDKQPFYYSPGYPALSTTSGTVDLVYLDVWQREVIDPDLRESALNGADTVNHVQTAWQVKVLRNVGAGGCADALPLEWAKLTAPSTGRLTVAAPKTPGSPAPCEIDPIDGYTGLENRLYRVEVHDSGTIGGGATFKWSRDNASLMARVTAVVREPAPGSGSVLSVASIGRDAWTRFKQDDHVEVLDDRVEFSMRETGTGGKMTTVKKVDIAAGTITVADDLSGVFGTMPPPKGLRMRLWSHAERPPGAAAEALTRPATGTVVLEDGIQITFDTGGVANALLHAGDYWVFAARTAEGRVEELVQAPPRGVLHHFARLARVTVGGETKDCRVMWPRQGGCCTAVVRPGEDIQAAIDSLDGVGGCVCLKMGVHEITAPLRIRQANVTLHGEAPHVTVRRTSGGPTVLLIEATAANNVHVQGIRFEGTASATASEMVRVDGLTDGGLSQCELVLTGGAASQGDVGVTMTSCLRVTIEECVVSGFPMGIAAQDSLALHIVWNQIVSLRQTTGGGLSSWNPGVIVSVGMYGVLLVGDTAGHHIEGNELRDFRRGIQVGAYPGVLDGSAMPSDAVSAAIGPAVTRVSNNVILRQGDDGGSNVGIAVHVARSEILTNGVLIPAGGDAGIQVAGADALVRGNALVSSVPTGAETAFGVIVYTRTDDAVDCTIRENVALGQQVAVAALAPYGRTGPASLDIVENKIVCPTEVKTEVAARLGTPRFDIGIVEKFTTAAPALLTSSVAVLNIRGGRIAGNVISDPVCGIVVGEFRPPQAAAVPAEGDRILIAGNQIMRPICGVMVLKGHDCLVADNTVADAFLASLLQIDCADIVMRANSLTRGHFGIVSVRATSETIDGNVIHGGVLGIITSGGADSSISGNRVEDTGGEGITSVLGSGHTVITHNRVTRSGYARRLAVRSRTATGIAILEAEDVTVESCHILDTGGGPAGPRRLSVPRIPLVVSAQRLRLQGCVVTSPPLPERSRNSRSRAVLVDITPGRFASHHADLRDNLVEQDAVTLVDCRRARATDAEVIFNANRCSNLSSMPPGAATVTIDAKNVIAHGNRVAVTDRNATPSLEVTADTASIVGNTLDYGATLQVPLLRPDPYEDFNVVL